MAGAPSRNSLLAALVLVQVLFGGMAVGGKLVLPFVPPLALAFCRLATAALILLALERWLVRSRLPPAIDLARFALFAALGVVLNQGLFLSGLERTTATNAVLLIATIPVFTLLVAVLMGHERARAVKLVGLGVSFAGVFLLVLRSGLEFGTHTLVGDGLVLLNSLAYSTYLVFSRPALDRYDPLTLIAWVFVFGTVEMAPFAAAGLLQVDWAALTPIAWTAFAYVILGATVVTYGVNNWVLRHTSASHVATFVYLQPLVGATLAAVVLGEAITIHVLLAGALILAGVAIATRVSPRPRAGNPSE